MTMPTAGAACPRLTSGGLDDIGFSVATGQRVGTRAVLPSSVRASKLAWRALGSKMPRGPLRPDLRELY